MTDVLIVDDDPVFGELTLERLADAGYEASFHTGPFGTVNAVRAQRPRLLLLDVNMPGLSGAKVGHLIRRTPGMRSMRIVLYSSMDQQELNALVGEYGADAALHKSASRTEVLRVVGRVLTESPHAVGGPG